MKWFLECFKKYGVFKGRARRKEFWFFVLFNCIVSIILTTLQGGRGSISDVFSPVLALSVIYSLAVLVPGLAVTVRRLHDTNRSGGWIFISLIPLVGAIILIVFTVQDSTPGENDFGPNPKEEGAPQPE